MFCSPSSRIWLMLNDGEKGPRSLGHKVNHSFLPNSVFGTMFHPRWGRVRTVVTTSLVRAGEEILVDYGYDLVRCPDWYRNMWTDTIGAKTGLNYLEYRK